MKKQNKSENYLALLTNICIIIFIIFAVSYNSLAQESSGSETVHYIYQPGDHELFLMPTAYTMEQGSAYFSSFELIFLNFTYAPTSTTHIGAFFLFPVTSSFLETITLGLKQNYYRSDYFQSALWGSYTIKNGLYTVGNVVSAGAKSASFHFGLAFTGETEKGNNALLFLLGGRADFSSKLSGIVEYTNAKELLDEDFKGILSFGICFRGESTSWELAGIRPLAYTGDLLLIPFLKATFLF
jgi:hypothetical protein